jgi:2-polyprenyl-3-methyl-5-hydroxy-6-metoxy-1,4-benzoquinol methylase
MVQKCNLCGHKSFSHLFDSCDRFYGIKGQFKLYKCLNCGIVFIYPQPSDVELAKYYPKNYYSYSPGKTRAGLIGKIVRYLKDPFRIFYILLYVKVFHFDKGLSPIAGGNILDVGCGAGDFLVKFKQKGMNCYGVEIDSTAAETAKARGLNITIGQLENGKFSDDYFDIIVVHHVLEHLRDPQAVIQKIKRLLKPSGLLVVAVPNIESLCFWVFRKYWSQLDVPRHLYSFSKKTLSRYLEDEGFNITKIACNSTPFQFLSSIICLIDRFWYHRVLLKDASAFAENSILWFILSPLVVICNMLKIGDSIDIRATK